MLARSARVSARLPRQLPSARGAPVLLPEEALAREAIELSLESLVDSKRAISCSNCANAPDGDFV